MKLAEALIQRAETLRKIEQLRHRLSSNAQVQEGLHPDENPQTLLQELRSSLNQLTRLIQQINRTNVQTPFDAQQQLSDALARRESLLKEIQVLQSFAEAARQSVNRYSLSEIRYVPTLPVAQTQQEIDQLAKAYRELDTRIQQLNWNTDLLE